VIGFSERLQANASCGELCAGCTATALPLDSFCCFALSGEYGINLAWGGFAVKFYLQALGTTMIQYVVFHRNVIPDSQD
jgi:hypothetical protein